jgi:hypothetical protein
MEAEFVHFDLPIRGGQGSEFEGAFDEGRAGQSFSSGTCSDGMRLSLL